MSKQMTDEEWIRSEVDSITTLNFDPTEISACREFYDALAAGEPGAAWAVLHDTGLTQVDLILIRARGFRIT